MGELVALESMLADVHILHESDVYRILDFRCHCNICSLTDVEYNNNLCISFVRKGFFEYRTFRRKDEVHIGRILISKPEFEHVTRHIDNQPDINTVFEFKKSFFHKVRTEYSGDATWFFQNKDVHAILLACPIEADYLHHQVMAAIQGKRVDRLYIDDMVMQMMNSILLLLGKANDLPVVSDRLKRNHLQTIEKAKEYILDNFVEDISLNELAEHCYVSPFHFSRIFKSILNVSPHQYLLATRLNHARILLSTTDRPVNDIGFESGFNSLEHFVTAYKQQFQLTPTQQRSQATPRMLRM